MTWWDHFLVLYILAFHTVHGLLMARILELFAISSFSGPLFVRILHCVLSTLGGSAWVAWFIELCKPVLHEKTVIYEWKQCRRHLTIRFPLKQGSEREKQVSYINAYIREFRKMVLMNRTILWTRSER